MQTPTPLPPIRFADLAAALLRDVEHLLVQWLPNGVRKNHEYVCGSLAGGAGTSCSVNLNTGQWADFSTGEKGGDLLSLYAVANGLTMGKAAAQVARENGLEDVAGLVRTGAPGSVPPTKPRPPAPPPKPAIERESWQAICPVPAHAVAPTFRHYERKPEAIEHRAEYRVGEDLYGYVIRFVTSDGGKETLPYTWCESARDGASKWHWRQWDEPRPLFFPGHAAPNGRTVVLVEGERKAESLQNLLDVGAPGVFCVASWPGGCKAWKKSNWQWLQGCTVLLWPDCDAKRTPLPIATRKATTDKAALGALQLAQPIMSAEKQPGMQAMLGIGALLGDVHGCTVLLLPIPAPGDVVDGWDCRDAIEIDSWDFERVQAFFAQAYALQPSIDNSSVAGVLRASEKIAAPVSTNSGSDAGFVCEKINGYPIPGWMMRYFDAKKERWLVSRKMVITVLERDDALAGVVAYNELSNSIQARRPWPWRYGTAGDVTNTVDLLLGKYMTDNYGLPSIPRAALSEAIQTVAHTERFHPIREYLQGLKWDGNPRLDKWLVHAIGETPTSLGPALTEYLKLVGRYWLLGMVYRVMQPGCKFDYCPVLEGSGGLRKSTLVEVLASSEFFSDTKFDVSKGKEAQEQVQGVWLYEIAELAHFGRSEVSDIKAFISSKTDRYRVAYGTTVSSFPRQCVLAGTTNEKTYLQDRSGNRRFWPIPVRHVINTEWVSKYRDQLMAEAFVQQQQGACYTPTKDDEDRLFEPMQESRLVDTAVLGELLHVLTRPPQPTGSGVLVNELAEFVTMPDLVRALDVDPGKSTAGLEKQIRTWMVHEGWIYGKRQVGGVRKSGYARPANWPQQEVVPVDTPLDVSIPGGLPGDDAPF